MIWCELRLMHAFLQVVVWILRDSFIDRLALSPLPCALLRILSFSRSHHATWSCKLKSFTEDINPVMMEPVLIHSKCITIFLVRIYDELWGYPLLSITLQSYSMGASQPMSTGQYDHQECSQHRQVYVNNPSPRHAALHSTALRCVYRMGLVYEACFVVYELGLCARSCVNQPVIVSLSNSIYFMFSP